MAEGEEAKRMVCMEVWGGSEPVDSAVTLPGLEAWVYSRPYKQSREGGDVYYASACASGRIDRLLVADVSGHGQAVSAVGIQLRDLMRRYVNYLDQSKFVLSMNRQFVACSEAGCFATAVVMTFFAPTRTLTVCNAGHPAPLVWRAQSGDWSVLERGGQAQTIANLPLGILDLEDYVAVLGRPGGRGPRARLHGRLHRGKGRLGSVARPRRPARAGAIERRPAAAAAIDCRSRRRG
jgi:hypothetical protein